MIIKRDVEKRGVQTFTEQTRGFSRAMPKEQSQSNIWQAKCPVKKASDNLSIRKLPDGHIGQV